MLRIVLPRTPTSVVLRRLEVCEGLTVGIDQVGEFAHGVLLVRQPSGEVYKHIVTNDHDNFEVLNHRVDGIYEGCCAMIAAGFMIPGTEPKAA